MSSTDLALLLAGIGDGHIGMDSSVVPLRFPGLLLVSTTDFFYPNVSDPYLQGRIACANVLSDMYAMGIADVDNMLMILAASLDMPERERMIVTRLLIEGFAAQAKLAGTTVTGGQTVKNPWPIIGGVAKSVVKTDEIIMPEGALPGDVLVLTKPLGTQVAVNVFQWIGQRTFDEKVGGVLSVDEALLTYSMACESMARLNRNGARLMHKYAVRAGTDVTGFGLLGHGTNLALNQKAAVRLHITRLPILPHMVAVDARRNGAFRLRLGMSAETSGGLLVALPAGNAQAFIDELRVLDGQPAWIVGVVEPRPTDLTQNDCLIDADAELIDVRESAVAAPSSAASVALAALATP